jgi:hypothetical protein
MQLEKRHIFIYAVMNNALMSKFWQCDEYWPICSQLTFFLLILLVALHGYETCFPTPRMLQKIMLNGIPEHSKE